jgi:hypothetical protein
MAELCERGLGVRKSARLAAGLKERALWLGLSRTEKADARKTLGKIVDLMPLN